MKKKKFVLLALCFGLLTAILPLSVSAQEPLQCEIEYTVQEGDWLSKIAEKYLGDVLAYPQLVELANASDDDAFTNIENADLIEPGWTICIPSTEAIVDTVTEADMADASTTIELADGTQCLFAGTGAGLAFDGKRVNYTCGEQGDDIVGLIGDVLVEVGHLNAEKVIIGHGDDGFFVKETIDVSGPATVIQLKDGDECFNAGQGATVAFDGKRLNFSCDFEKEDQVGLLGDFTAVEGLFTVEKATIGHNDDDGFFVKDSGIAAVTLISQKAFTMTEDTTEESMTDLSLVGPVWQWEQTNMNNDDTFIPTNPANYTLQFMADGTFSAQADCNQVSGTYTTDGSSITITPGPTTLALCPEESLGEQYTAQLAGAAIYFFQDEMLFIDLQFDSGTMRFSQQTETASEG